MKRLIILLSYAYAASMGQQGQSPVTPLPKCIIPFTINSNGTGAQGHLQPSITGYDNRQTGCTNWSLVYTSSGYTVISLRIESAPSLSNVAPGTPNTYVDFAGTVTGVNPSVATDQSPGSGPTFVGYYPWMRINASTLTGVGQIVGVLIGTLPLSVTGGSSSGGGSSGCVGTVGTPCVVTGACDTNALFNLSGSGSTQVIAISGTTIVDICGVSLSTVATEDIKIVYGTGANCVTSPIDLTGLYKAVQAMVLSFPVKLSSIAGQAICINQSVAQATGGVISYARR